MGSVLSLARVAICLFTCALSALASAADFREADRLFDRRSEGLEVIAAARSAYLAALPGSTVGERIYALDMVGRLAYYEGFLVPDADKAKRKALFQGCLDEMEKHIQPRDVGENPEYYYWKGVCLASWADANGIASSLKRSGELVALIDKGLEVDSTFEGGGFYRLGAAVYQELPPVNPFGPTYDIEKSVTYGEQAIASPAYSGAFDPITATGDYFFDVYVYYATALRRSGDEQGARDVLEEAITRIEQGDVALDREPETKVHLEQLREALRDLNM